MLKIALIGFGTVGQSVVRILCEGVKDDLSLVMICNRQVEKKRVDWVPSDVAWTSDIDAVLSSDADVVVELIGGTDPATAWIRRSLESGKSVVTANKQVIAHDGADLMAVAARRGCHLLFEAAVAGGIPVVRSVQEGLTGDKLVRLCGLLNGTCNYILTRMETAQIPFDDALGEAQAHGFAEADPTADVDGGDAQAKLAILTAVGLGTPVAVGAIPLQSIRAIEPIDFTYAQRLDCTIRQVSRAELIDSGTAGVTASVQPMLVPTESALARAKGSQNVVVVEGVRSGETAFSGFGAGGDPTAVAVVSDLAALARGGVGPSTWPLDAATADVRIDFTSRQYVRFVVVDRPGIIAQLADVFARFQVNFDSLLQEPGWSKSELPFVITLERCSTRAVREALNEIATFDFHARQPVWMPILTQRES